MKNLLKKFRSNSPFGGWEAFRMYILLLPIVGGWGATSCSLTEALKPTPQIDEYGLDKNAPFACLVNGKKWEPMKDNFYTKGVGLYLIKDSLRILAHHNNLPQSINLLLNNFKNVGTFYHNSSENLLLFYDKDHYPLKNYPKTIEGQVIIQQYNTSKKIVSGVFNFVSVAEKDTFRVTQGRFNLNF